ncbi:MAG: ThuA domain-containing protein [Fimbriimonadaceae bacterium]
MPDRRALIVWGGWDGHEPEQVAGHFAEVLERENFDVKVSNTLDSFLAGDMQSLSLIVPVWTMGEISGEQCRAVCDAVAIHGVGLAGCHGGMCDSFRNNTEWQFMTGGQWVAHPGDDQVRYRVEFRSTHPVIDGLPDFWVKSEQYFLHTDPGNTVLATTRFPHEDVAGPHSANPCDMPQVWTKSFGKGRVFYNALGHNRAVFEIEAATELMRRGFLWAAKGVGL